MTEQISFIPARLKNAAQNGHVAGAEDIIDDDLQMTQAQINEMLLGGSISVGLSSSANAMFIGEAKNLTLTATCSVTATTIQITGGSIESPTTGSNVTSHTQADSIANVTENVTYNATFMIGGLEKHATKTVYAVHPIYYGAGAAYTDITTRASARTSYNGTYTMNNPVAAQYIWFLIPASISTSKPNATMGIMEFPLDDAEDVTIDGVAYKAYKSSNTQDAGDYTIVLS